MPLVGNSIRIISKSSTTSFRPVFLPVHGGRKAELCFPDDPLPIDTSHHISAELEMLRFLADNEGHKNFPLKNPQNPLLRLYTLAKVPHGFPEHLPFLPLLNLIKFHWSHPNM